MPSEIAGNSLPSFSVTYPGEEPAAIAREAQSVTSRTSMIVAKGNEAKATTPFSGR